MENDGGWDGAASAFLSVGYVRLHGRKKGKKIGGKTGFRGEKRAGMLSWPGETEKALAPCPADGRSKAEVIFG